MSAPAPPNMLYQMIQKATFPTTEDKRAALEMAALMTPQPAVPAVSATTTALIDMLRQRDAAGLKKYGTTLDRTDLSLADWLQHQVEEQLDAAGYALAALRTLNEQGTMVPESAGADIGGWRIDPEPWVSNCGIWTCNIDIGKHGGAIECHGDTKEEALRRAQAVMRASADQPYCLDEDPAGIRARVTGAISVALGEGAYGNIEPPEGHWLAPFWHMARAEAKKAQPAQRPEEDDAPIDADGNAAYIGHCAEKLTRLGYPVTGSVLKAIGAEHCRLAAGEHQSTDIDSIALDAARRCTPEGEPQRRARMQCAIADAILAQQNDDAPMIGKMVEANFSTQLVTFRMVGGYKCRAGEYRIQRAPRQDGDQPSDEPRHAPSTKNRN